MVDGHAGLNGWNEARSTTVPKLRRKPKLIEAYSGKEAIARFSAREDINLVITDQAMPGMTGIELIDRLDAIRPGTPVILASGYGEGLDVHSRHVLRLAKPFDQSRLRRAVSQSLA